MAAMKQTRFSSRLAWALGLLLLTATLPTQARQIDIEASIVQGAIENESVFQATGVKIGEVTNSTAIVWTRLTQNAQRVPLKTGAQIKIVCDGNGSRKPSNGVKDINIVGGESIDELIGATPGAPGYVCVQHQLEESSNEWRHARLKKAKENRDHTTQFLLEDLEPNSKCLIKVESKSTTGEDGEILHGSFRTAPSKDQTESVKFVVAGCHDNVKNEDRFVSYEAMLNFDPDFFAHAGDIVHYDKISKTLDLARCAWQSTYSDGEGIKDLHRHVPSYFMRDDHDTWQNNCCPGLKNRYMGEFTFKQGQDLFNEQVPIGKKTYRTMRWGTDLQIWMIEGRDFRTPGKTILGEVQLEWLKKTVEKSDATFRILISPTPIVGPDGRNGSSNDREDCHANEAFKEEGDCLRGFIAQQENMIVITGDRHWQYESVHPSHRIREFCVGPVSERKGKNSERKARESGGSLTNPDHHRHVAGVGGFMSGTVERVDGTPTLILQHRNINGDVINERVLTKENVLEPKL